VSGDGVESLGASVGAVGAVQAQLNEAGDVRFLSETTPRRLMHAGWFALRYGEAAVTWFHYLQLEDEYISLIPFDIIATDLIYHFDPGVSCYLWVYW
jgi:hypothetical protein